MTFRAIHSNQVERLAGRLFADLAAHRPVNPLAAGHVLVDNQVLGEWVNLRLAQEQGIAANIRYLRPHELFWQLARALVAADIPRETPLSKEEMAWRLFGLLGDASLLAETAMLPVRRYLAEGACQDLKRYQLAAAVADLFDQYLIYRPDWIAAWSVNRAVTTAGDLQASEAWQRCLWQALEARALNSGSSRPGMPGHRAAIERVLLDTLAHSDKTAIAAALPFQRLNVFGITTMPPKQVELLVLLGQHIDVTLYVLNPCTEYWTLIRSARELAKQAAADNDSADGYYEIGNPLLASQGVQVRDFISLLQEVCDDFDADFDDSTTPLTLLQAIQHEIRDLQYQGTSADAGYVTEGHRQPLPAQESCPAAPIPSVHIHNCHSAMREVEVLHDQLRDMLTHNPGLQPRDIVVMMPQVAPYVPYIHAVFNSVPEALRIPYHITDRTLLEESPLLNSLTVLLQLPASRLPLSEVLSLLEVPALQRRFGLAQDDYNMLKGWLVASGARWGVDAQHRAQCGLPAYSDFSWAFALDRLMAGYAMPVGEIQNDSDIIALDDTLPFMALGGIEGGNAAVLDAFLRYWNRLLHWRAALQENTSASQWAARLRVLVEDFYELEDDSEYQAMKAVYQALRVLDSAESQHWFGGNIALPVIQALMKPVLKQPAAGRHHWREGVKFCSLLPMRGVPFKVVYVLGMNLEDYPRQVEKTSFDLMRKSYRAGDRVSRIDDRWLFLEALLSARQYFHVSYVGRDMHRNDKREPSVVLSELIDYVQHGYDMPEAGLQTEHPLQPFGDAYFLQDKPPGSQQLVSYNTQAFAIARARHQHQQQQQASAETQPTARWQLAIPADTTGTVSVSLDDFVQFFTRPWDWFLKRKHGIWLDLQQDNIDDDECYGVANGLDAWQLRNDLIQLINASEPIDGDTAETLEQPINTLVQQRQAQGRWPVGAAGLALQDSLRDMKPAYLLASYGKARQPVVVSAAVNTACGTVWISGEIPLAGQQFLVHSASKHRADKQLDFVLRLIVALCADNPVAIDSALAVYSDGDKHFKATEAIDQPELAARSHRALLEQLAQLYMQYRNTGLPFDPALSYKLHHTDTSEPEAVETLLDEYWYGNYNREGAASDLSRRIFFGGVQTLHSAAFRSVADCVWGAVAQWSASAGDTS